MAWEIEKLPFLEQRHYEVADRTKAWLVDNRNLVDSSHRDHSLEICREIVKQLGVAGLLDYVVPDPDSDPSARLDIRSICIVREGLAYESCLVDSMFVMQGLGLTALWHHLGTALRETYLRSARRGDTIAALAVTELDAGSDVAAISTTAKRDGDHFILNGHKAWITNGGLADHYMVVARTGEAEGARGLSAFLVDARTQGVSAGAQEEIIAPHPMAAIAFNDVRVEASRMVGTPGNGFRTVMAGFDIFRPSVGAAALGAARRALDETVGRVETRRMFGKRMAELDVVRARIADMVTDVETAKLAVYRAAWAGDVVGGKVSHLSAIAKLVATEAAQRVADSAVQLFGALGVSNRSVIERIYRDVRPMRIYEGASEIQKIVIARAVLGASG
jgi:acyl-CoA dehydrogenase